MAGLQKRNKGYRVIFRYHGKQHTLNLGKVSEDEAEAKSAQVNYLLMRLKQGLSELPPGTDIVKFVKHDGKVPPTAEHGPARKAMALTSLRDRYLATYAHANERNSRSTRWWQPRTNPNASENPPSRYSPLRSSLSLCSHA